MDRSPASNALPTSVEELQALLTTAAKHIAKLEKERDNLRASHERLRQELELFRRRLFVAKAERADNEHQLRLEFEAKVRELDALAGTLGLGDEDDKPRDETPAKDGKPKGKRRGNRGTGRRDLKTLPLEEERIEIADPHLEDLVAQGKVVRHGFEQSCKLAHRRACRVRLVVARVRYKTVDVEGNADVITTAMPDEMLPTRWRQPHFGGLLVPLQKRLLGGGGRQMPSGA